MKQVSSKTAARNREYAQRRRTYLLTHPNCEIMWDGGCNMQAAQTHHVIPRVHLNAEQMLDERNWLSTCNHCHHMTHTRPAEAWERGALRRSWEWGWWEGGEMGDRKLDQGE